MTRFGFTADDFAKLADLMAACIKNGTDVKEEVKALRADHMKMQYCFDDQDMVDVMDTFAKKTGL
jgi:glycine/serine hydroxymethyltransferase